MRKDKTDKQTLDRESALIKTAFDKGKTTNPSLTQDSLADEFSLSQGLIGQWLTGKTRVPDSRLIKLSKILDFDPLEVRPALSDYQSINQVREESPLYNLLDQCIQAGLDDQAEVILRGVLATAQSKK